MNAHQLDADGVILNTIVVDSLDVFPNLVDAYIGGQIGDSIVAGALLFKPAEPPTREEKKAARAAAVDAIKVTTSGGHEFDGDEVSQTRMVRAIVALQATGTPSINWTLSDNSIIDASAAELVEALALSGAAQAAVWVIT